MPSGVKGDVGDIMALRLASEGDPTLWPCNISWGDHPWGDGIAMDARGLCLAENDTGDMPAGMPGLGAPDIPKGPGKGKPGVAWLLDAEEVGIGGEKGSGGYWCDGCRLIEVAGDIAGGGGGTGSSSPNETPNALSFASFNSSTYFFQAG